MDFSNDFRCYSNPKIPQESNETIHLASLPEATGQAAGGNWEVAMDIRSAALKALEEARGDDGISNPLDAGIAAVVDSSKFTALEPYAVELADLCGVSRFDLQCGESTTITVQNLSDEPRCQRSWKRDGTVKERDGGFLLSDRDAEVVSSLSLEA